MNSLSRKSKIKLLETLAVIFFVIAISYPEGWGAQRVFLQRIWRLHIVEIMFIVLLCLTLNRYLMTSIFHRQNIFRNLMKNDPLGLTIIVVIGVYTIFFLEAVVNGIPINDIANDFRAVPLMLTYFLGKLLVKNDEDLQFLLKLFIIGCVIHALITMFILPFRKTIFYPIYQGTSLQLTYRVWFRNSGLYIISLSIIWIYFGKKEVTGMQTIFHKKFYFVAFAFIIFSSIISQSRMLFLSIGLTLLFILFRERKKIVSITLVLLISGVLFLPISRQLNVHLDIINNLTEKVTSTISGKDSSINTRSKTNRYNIDKGFDYPFFGHGFGVQMLSINPLFIHNAPETNFIDNLYISLWFKTGITGLIFYLLLLIMISFSVFKYKNNNNLSSKYLSLSLLVALPAFLLYCTVTSSFLFYTRSVIVGFFVLLGALHSHNRRDEADKTIPDRSNL